jgi:pre-mRNA-splicing factor CWC26
VTLKLFERRPRKYSSSRLKVVMSLADYLAKNYLTAEGPTKKKKRKRETNLNVIDDSENLVPLRRSTNQLGDDEDLADAQVVGDVVEDRPSIPREKRWKPAIKEEEEDRPDELPTLEMDTETERAVMSSGARAGLQTGAEVAAAIKKRQQREMEEFKKSKLTGKELETVYRDATGRRIDPMLRRAEARYQQEKRERDEREAKEEEEKKQKELRAGLAQQREREARREELKRQETQSFSATKEDEDYNEAMKARERWNDPAAAFLSKDSQTKKKGKRLIRNVPVYLGAAPPNRFGIRPGYRWDGVCLLTVTALMLIG